MGYTRIATLVGVGAVLWTGLPVYSQPPRPRVVALTGRPVPEVDGSMFTMINRPVVGSGGAIYFTGEYNAIGGFRKVLMFSPPLMDGTTIFRREGDPVAELGGLPVVWGNTFGLLAAERQFCLFTGTYGGGGMSGTGVWQSDGTTLSLRTTAAAGVNAPGTTAPFGAFHFLAAAQGGRFAVRASTGGASTANTGVWTGVAAGVAPFVIEGDLPPDVGAGVEYDDFGAALHDPAIDSGGVMALIVPLRGTGVTAANNRGLLVGPPGGERMVARTGGVAPQMPAGAVFATLTPPWMNDDHDVVFSGRVTGGGVGPNDDEGLWIVRWPSTSPELVVREGLPLPQFGTGIILHERTSGVINFRQTIITNEGTIYFVSGLLGSGIHNDNDGVIYQVQRMQGGGWMMNLVAREGQDAPGLTPGVDRYGPFGQIWANGTGRLAFTCQILGSSFWALFGGERGRIRVIAAASRTIDVGVLGAPDVRTVRPFYSQFGPLYSSGGGDGFATCLSEASTLVYRADFVEGGIGVFEITLSRSDVNGDGVTSVQDIFDFLNRWFSMDLSADFNGDGMLSVQDIFDLLMCWFSLC